VAGQGRTGIFGVGSKRPLVQNAHKKKKRCHRTQKSTFAEHNVKWYAANDKLGFYSITVSVWLLDTGMKW